MKDRRPQLFAATIRTAWGLHGTHTGPPCLFRTKREAMSHRAPEERLYRVAYYVLEEVPTPPPEEQK